VVRRFLRGIFNSLSWLLARLRFSKPVSKVFKIRYNRELVQFNKFFKLHNGRNIFVCKIDFIDKEFAHISQVSRNVILVTGNGDRPVTKELLTRLPRNVVKWYAQNVEVVDDRVVPIPLGLENHEAAWRFGHGHAFFRAKRKLNILSRPVLTEPSKFLYANFSVNTNYKLRSMIYELVSEVCYIHAETACLNVDEYFARIAEYKMNICPFGNGYDTHRLWETLYASRVPVVIRGAEDIGLFKLYEKLPIVILDEVKELLNFPLLEKKYHQVKNQDWDLALLNFSFWQHQILTSSELSQS
jgi:hypothetical protein